MVKKIFIQNLPEYITEKKLKELFSLAGNVDSATIVRNKINGRPNGTGFVDMASEIEVEKAITVFNGKEVDGLIIKVNKAIMLDT